MLRIFLIQGIIRGDVLYVQHEEKIINQANLYGIDIYVCIAVRGGEGR